MCVCFAVRAVSDRRIINVSIDKKNCVISNECNKVVIELRVVQFLSEIILVISNRTRTARSFNFEITHDFRPNRTLLSSITAISWHFSSMVLFSWPPSQSNP